MSLTLEEIIEILGGDPDEIIECEDGLVMDFDLTAEDE